MFDIGICQLSDDELVGELHRRYEHVLVATSHERGGGDTSTIRFSGTKSMIVYLAAKAQSDALLAEVE